HAPQKVYDVIRKDVVILTEVKVGNEPLVDLLDDALDSLTGHEGGAGSRSIFERPIPLEDLVHHALQVGDDAGLLPTFDCATVRLFGFLDLLDCGEEFVHEGNGHALVALGEGARQQARHVRVHSVSHRSAPLDRGGDVGEDGCQVACSGRGDVDAPVQG